MQAPPMFPALLEPSLTAISSPRTMLETARSASKDLPIAWALFRHDAALSSGSSRIPAIAASKTCRLTLVHVAGQPVLRVDDASLPAPGFVPWSNVAAFGEPPTSH